MTKKTTGKLHLVHSLIGEFIVLILLSALVFILMNYLHAIVNQNLLIISLLVFSLGKVYYLLSITISKMEFLTKNNHSFKHLIILSAIIISLINISFTFDYICLSGIYSDAFTGIVQNQSLAYRFFDFLYFSVITFTTVGYGDITPVILTAKLLTMLEMVVAFITIVFIISRYTKINDVNG